MTNDLEQRLRDAFEYRADRTVVDGTAPTPSSAPGRDGHNWTSLLAVAAAGVVLVGGLVAVRAASERDPSPTDQTSAMSDVPANSLPAAAPIQVVSDPLTIDLDAWGRPPGVGATDLRFVVLDTNRLPDGFTVLDVSASTRLGGTAEAPAYDATTRLAMPDGDEVSVSTGFLGVGPCKLLADDVESSGLAIGETYDVNGIEATDVAGTLCWNPSVDSAATAAVFGTSPTTVGHTEDVTRFAEVARQLRFVDIDRLPATITTERAPDPTLDAPDDVDFAGTIGGVPWSVTVSDTTLRAMNVYVDGTLSGGFEHDRLSQPTDFPASVGEVMINGTRGSGAMVFGYALPDATGLIVRSGGGRAVRLPLIGDELQAYFAFPIPEGVTIESAEFVDESGSVVAEMHLPEIPLDLDGGYGGVADIRRV